MPAILEPKIKQELKLSDSLNNYTKQKARAIGIAHNAFLTMLIDMGLRYYEGEVTIVCKCPQECKQETTNERKEWQ